MPISIPKKTSIETIILLIIDICVTPISGVVTVDEAKLITDLITSHEVVKAEPFFQDYIPEDCLSIIDENERRFESFMKSVVAIFLVFAAQDKLPFKVKMKVR